MIPEWWYDMNLQRHFDRYYHIYEETAIWHAKPDVNKWLFDLQSARATIILICDNDGTVTGERF